MYTFKKKDIIVESWVSLILRGDKTFEEVPALFNLREVVEEILKEKGFIEENKEQ